MIRFMIPGEPVAKARPKFRAVHTGVFKENKKSGATEEVVYPQTHTPKQSVNFENLVRYGCAEVMGATGPLSGPVRVRIVAYFGIPKSYGKRKTEEAVASERVPLEKRPDIDNVMKSVLDGLNTVAFGDDKQVSFITCEKYYSGRPRTVIEISEHVNESLSQESGVSV